MDELGSMLWIETRKAFRSKMPLWTGAASLFMPMAVAFLIFVARNPEISKKLGLVSAKANLFAYSATDWLNYLRLSGQMLAAGGFVIFVLIVAWVFGREFVDGTLKDMLAIPINRTKIVLAKMILIALWDFGLTILILASSLLMGFLIQLPGGSPGAILQGSFVVVVTGCLTIAVILPFGLFASMGRGYLLPMGMAILILMMSNIVAMVGWGEYFPWAVAGLSSQGKEPMPIVSYLIVFLTCGIGVWWTDHWWKHADQHR